MSCCPFSGMSYDQNCPHNSGYGASSLNPVDFVENNGMYFNNNSQYLKSTNYTNNNPNLLRKINGPTVIAGDLYVEGQITSRETIKSNMYNANEDIYIIKADVCNLKCQNDNLRNELDVTKKMLEYICKRFSINMTDITENIEQHIETLSNRTKAEERLDAIIS